MATEDDVNDLSPTPPSDLSSPFSNDSAERTREDTGTTHSPLDDPFRYQSNDRGEWTPEDTGSTHRPLWTNKALHMLAHWTPAVDKGYAKFLVYGRTTHTPVDTTIRGVALDTIRMMRAVRTSQYHEAAKTVRQKETKWHIAGPPTRAEIQKAVGTRLACAMHEDWRAAIGQQSKTDGAAKSGRPMTPTEFNRRWAAVCDIIEGRCVPRPDRINSYRAES